MGSDNKRIRNLVSESDEDTSELEILPDTIAADPDVDYESESDAATHSFESLNRKRDDPSVAALQSELRERDEIINRLQFDVEQLRARWTGLETELKVREELTKNVTSELTQANLKLTEAEERLKIREGRIATLESTVSQQEELLGDADGSLAQARKESGSLQSAVDDLNIRNSEAMTRIHSLIGELNHEKSERERARAAEQSLAKAFRELQERQAEYQLLTESLRHYIEGRKDRWDRQEAELRAKEELLENQRKKLGEFTRDIKHDTKRLRKEQAARQNLQTQNEVLQQDNGQLQREAAELKSLMADAEASAGNAQEQADSLAARLADAGRELEEEQFERRSLASELKERQDEVASLREEISALRNKIAQLRQDNASLEAAARNHEESMSKRLSEIEALKAAAAYKVSLTKEHAELSGLVASNEATIKELKLRIAQNEAYADTLRMKMQKQLADHESITSERQSVQASLQAALGRADDLAAQLQTERNANAELAEANRENQRIYEEEIRKIRFELDAAQDTLAETQTINEQLTSDLIDTTGIRHALEAQLIETDEDRKKEIKALDKQLTQSKKRIEDLERKVANKDAAINALLTELANKPHLIAAESEEDNVVHKLANKKTDEKTSQEKDRVTRLLIGNIDGQELRFPLFKDKLTIGRTAHNDIQLKAQYISRRHAVVVTDDECTRIVDWGSKNGIYVNGARATEKILKNGDRITVGTAQFKFEERPKR